MKYIYVPIFVLAFCHGIYAMDDSVPMSPQESAQIQRILSLAHLSPASSRAVKLWTGELVMLARVNEIMSKLRSLYNENPSALYNLKRYVHESDGTEEMPSHLLDVCMLYGLCALFTPTMCNDARAVICAGVNVHMRYPIVWLTNPLVSPAS